LVFVFSLRPCLGLLFLCAFVLPCGFRVSGCGVCLGGFVAVGSFVWLAGLPWCSLWLVGFAVVLCRGSCFGFCVFGG
jgi:hypothetical protein